MASPQPTIWGLGTTAWPVTHLLLVLCPCQVVQQALHLLPGEAPAEEILHQAEKGRLHRPDVIGGRGLLPGGVDRQKCVGMCPLSPTTIASIIPNPNTKPEELQGSSTPGHKCVSTPHIWVCSLQKPPHSWWLLRVDLGAGHRLRDGTWKVLHPPQCSHFGRRDTTPQKWCLAKPQLPAPNPTRSAFRDSSPVPQLTRSRSGWSPGRTAPRTSCGCAACGP